MLYYIVVIKWYESEKYEKTSMMRCKILPFYIVCSNAMMLLSSIILIIHIFNYNISLIVDVIGVMFH